MPRGQPISQELHRKILALHKAGKGVKLIGQEVGMDSGSIGRILRRGSIVKPPKPSGRPHKTSTRCVLNFD